MVSRNLLKEYKVSPLPEFAHKFRTEPSGGLRIDTQKCFITVRKHAYGTARQAYQVDWPFDSFLP